jgi:hypothetical protein
MATYTTPLRIKLLADGEEPGIWGQSTNTNLSTVLESAITGVKTLSPGDVNYTLTALNALADDARNAVLVFTGARTAVRTITTPNVNKTYIITNSTTGGFGITISAGAGATVTIPNGATAVVYCDGSTGFYLVHSTIPITNTVMNSTKLTGLTAGTTTGDSVEYAQMNTAITAVIPSGTKMPFYQASPPTGWTATAIQNDSMMRVVTAAGTGGTSGAGAGHSPILNNVVTSHTHVFTGDVLAAHTHTDSGHTHTLNVSAQLGGGGGGGDANSGASHPLTNTGFANLSSVSAGTPSGTNAVPVGAANWQPKYMDFCVGTKT